jgi:signal transduction histidine kinase
VLVAPLIGRTGVLGALAFAACQRQYGPVDLTVAEGLARIAADTMENSRLYAEAQEAARHREDVLAIVSHDLRSPLATVRAAIHGLANSPDGDSRSKRLEMIDRATQRMDRLIGDLLQAAAIRTGRLSVSPRPERLVGLINEALEGHSAVAQRRAIPIVRAFDDESLHVSCDRDRVVQVLSNLLGNALKFCREGATITVAVEPLAHEVRVSVRDTGPGIRQDDIAHLFDPYWSARRDVAKGTGLGLYISKGLIEAHGGRMGVESQLGRGTTFWFTLPRA